MITLKPKEDLVQAKRVDLVLCRRWPVAILLLPLFFVLFVV